MSGSRGIRSPRCGLHAFLVAAVLVCIFVSSVEPAFATHVGCGEVVTTSVKLDSDLTNCPGDGLVVGADGITIDLGGHTIAGDRSRGLLGSGIDAHLGYNRVVVENGTITTFFDGVLLRRSSGSALRNLTVTNVENGLHLVDSPGNTVEKNSISPLQPSGLGILVEGESDSNTVEKNNVSQANVGIELGNTGFESRKIPDGNLVQKNELRSNDFGMLLGGVLRNQIQKNLLVDNLTDIFAIGSDQNVIERNDMPRGDGVGSLGILLMESDDNRLSDDRIEGHFYGVLVQRGSTGTTVESNTTNRNADDGIHVDDPATTLTSNVADENGDLGIEAVPGVTDGGGNKARGNGNPAQCVNVACQ
jgi:parallel beta-helix repeat protein